VSEPGLHSILIAFLGALAEVHVIRNPTHLAAAEKAESMQGRLLTLMKKEIQSTNLQSPDGCCPDQKDQNLSLKSSRLPLFQAMCLLKRVASVATFLMYLPPNRV
jgi:hypothetical protein